MTDRLSDIAERIDNMKQLGAVVTAMRGIAAARTQQSRALILGIDAYTEAVSHAIGLALSLTPAPALWPGGGTAKRGVVLFCAEQGFAGPFTDRVLDVAAGAWGATLQAAKVILVGTRGARIAGERGIKPHSTIALANQITNIPEMANRAADTLYAWIARGDVAELDLFYSRVDEDRSLRVVRSRLLPVELEKFQAARTAIPPFTTLPPPLLLARLAEEYIYAKLCEAAMHSFAAENEARMQVMSSASNHVGRKLDELVQQEHHVRQEEVTAEIIELAAGAEVQRNRPRER